MELTHIDENGRPHMVSVEDKPATTRRATAQGYLRCAPETARRIREGGIVKGDVLSAAQVAGIMAAKRAWEIIPMCHPIPISGVEMTFTVMEDAVLCRATVSTVSPTGVEIEALQAVETALLTVYDMVKAVDRSMRIGGIALLEKRGGKSGDHVFASRIGTVLDVNISREKGTVKTPVAEMVLRENHGCEGDAHAGTWHRQVSLLAEESIDRMRAAGVALRHGDFAENITTRGLILHMLPVGSILAVGDAILEVTQIGKECHKGCAIRDKVGHCIMPAEGIFARVIRGGTIRPGLCIEVR